MLALPSHLEVKLSLIFNAGMGLFARRTLRKNKRIGRYRGTYYAKRCAGDSLPASHKPYLMATLGEGVIDGFTLANHMRWANHWPERANAYAKLENDGVIFFVALRTIEAGEEIYIDYGYDPCARDPEEPPPPPVPRCPQCYTAMVRVSKEQQQDRVCITCWIRNQY